MATCSSFLHPTSPPKPKAEMRTPQSTTSSLAPELPDTCPSFIRTPGPAIASSSSSTGTHNRHFRPRKRSYSHSSTPPIPRSAPCPPLSNYFNYGKHKHKHKHQNMQGYTPTIPPHATLLSLKAHRIHLLDQLQTRDWESTTILRSLRAIQGQLDHPLPLPPHEVKALRRNVKAHRWALWRSEQKERDILVWLGEVALRTQRIGRWGRVCWETQQGAQYGPHSGENWMDDPPAMNGQAYGAQNVYRVSGNRDAPVLTHIQAYRTQSGRANLTPQHLSAPAPVNSGYQYSISAHQMHSSPPNIEQVADPQIALEAMDYKQTQHIASPTVAWQQQTDVGGHGWNHYDNTSHVTSAATTRRNTAIGSMLPPNVPHNSRHGSIAVPGQGIFGSDLSQRIEQAVGSGRLRKSEPGLVGCAWSAEGQGSEYVEVRSRQVSSTGHDIAVSLRGLEVRYACVEF